MIKIDGVDIPRIEYIDPVDGKVSILRVMQDGVQIWPVDAEPLQIPTGIILREVIPTSIEWDYFITYTVNTNTEVRAYLKDDIILPFTGGDDTQFGLKVNGSLVVFTNFGIHYAPGQSYVTLRNPTDFLPTDVITFSYTAGADPIEGENTGTFAPDLVDQLVENTIEDEGKPNIPTGIQLSEYEIVPNIEWDYDKMYIGEGDNVNLVTLYFTGQDADITSIPAITDWVLDPFNVVNTVTVYTDRVELLMNTPFTSSSSVTISYSPGVNPLKDIDGYLLTELNDQALENLLELQIPTGITLREVFPSYTYLLEEYPGAVAAYSLRKLSSAVVQGVLVRKDDGQHAIVLLYDDPNKSIDLDSLIGDGTIGTLGEWCGSESVFIHTWEDQSGNGNHVSQSTEASQPRIINAGVLEVKGIAFDGINDKMTRSALSELDQVNQWSIFSVGSSDVTSSLGTILSTSQTEQSRFAMYMDLRSSPYRNLGHNNIWTDLSQPRQDTGVRLQTAISDTINLYGWDNSQASLQNPTTITTIANDIFKLGSQQSDTTSLNGNINEIIVYGTDQSANRTAIETNINDFYNIWVATAEVDAQLIQADDDGLSDTVIEINGIRSSASDTAVANLISRNVTIITA